MPQFLGRTLAIARKEVRQLRRDRLTFGMIVGIPLIQLVLFGYAINQDVRHLRGGVADLAGTQRSRILAADAAGSQVVDIVAQVETVQELEALLRRGRISVGIAIPRDFDRRIQQGERPPAQLLVDGSDPIVLGAAQGIAGLPVENRFQPVRPAAARLPGQTFEVRTYYNPERRSAVQIVPGLIGVILTLTMVLFTAIAIVRERERGNLELLITTPVRTWELMVGKVLPYMLVGLIQVTLVLLAGWALFRIPVRGSLVDFYLAGALFVTATLTMGLLVSTAAKTQFQSVQMAMFFFLPSILLSGFMFPFDGMPRWAQYFAEILPLTHFVRIVRGILLRGASLAEVHRDLYPLIAFMALTLSLSVLRFRKRLD
jgi:ABC-2 type transport system permease protein